MAMLRVLTLLAAIAGVALAAFAALAPETGVTGTTGAFLALTGSVAVLLALGILGSARPRGTLGPVLVTLAVIAAVLTGVAAWFLMQFPLAAVMAIAALGLLAGAGTTYRRAVA